MNEFGERLRKIRLAHGFSLYKLGIMCDFKKPSALIDAYESGFKYPDKDMITKLAKSLNVTERYLVYGVFDKETVTALKDKGIYESEYIRFELFNCYYDLQTFEYRVKNDLEFVRPLYNELLHSKEEKHENNR